MIPGRARTLLGLSTICMLLLVLGFGAVLSLGSFSKSVRQSYLSAVAITGAQSVRKIEYGLRYGKQLDNFVGMRQILQQVQADNPAVRNVQVLLPNGDVEEGLRPGFHPSAAAPVTAALTLLSRDTEQRMLWRWVDGQYHVITAIHGAAPMVQGGLDIVVDAAVIDSPLRAFETEIVQHTLLAGCVAVALFLLFWNFAPRLHSPGGLMQSKRILLFALLLLGLAQALLTARTLALVAPIYAASVQHNQALVGCMVSKDIAGVIAKGVGYAELNQLQAWLDDIPRHMPEIAQVTLRIRDDAAGPVPTAPAILPAQQAGPVAAVPTVPGSAALPALQLALPADASGARAHVEVALSAAFIASKNRAVVVDAMTLWVITIIFSIEMLHLLGRLIKAPARGLLSETAIAQRNTSLVRPQAFVLFLAISLSTSFLPVVLRGFEALPGLPVPVFLGLPLTVELLAALLATMAAGAWVDRRGWRASLLTGLLLLLAGTVLSALATSVPALLLARAVVGCGYGLGWTALRGLVANSTRRGSDVAALNAGIYAGINCGVILGALLTERLSYAGIFWASALLLLCTTVFCLAFTVASPPQPDRPQVPGLAWPALLRDRGVLVFLLAAALPTAICLMFLNYFVPLYARGAGLSSADVGRLFLLYGLVVVYLGPLLSRTVIPRYPFKLTTGVGFLGAVLGLLLFAFYPSPLTCTLAVLLLGLADALGLVAQNHLFLSRRSVQDFGVGRSSGLLGVVKRLGQALGALLFAWAASANQGLLALALALAFCWVLFMLCMPRVQHRVSP